MPPRKSAPKPNQSKSDAKRKAIEANLEEIAVDKGKGKVLGPNLVSPAIKGKESRVSSKLINPATLIADLTSGVIYTVCIHHSGRFTKKPNRNYVGGYEITYPLWGIQKLKMSDLSNLVKKFTGYADLPVYYKIPGMDLNLGLKFLSGEDDIHEIVENVDITGCCAIELYLDEFGSFEQSNVRDSHVNDVEPLLPDCDATLNDDDLNYNEEVEQMCQSVEASLGTHASESEDCDSDREIDSESDSEFRDSEYGQDDDDDDALYESYIDKNVEWGGVSETGNVAGGCSTNHVLDADMNDDDTCGLDDDLRSIHSSDDDSVRLPEFNSSSDLNKVEFSVGMLFATKDILTQAISEYGLQNGKAVQLYKNDKMRVRAWCTKGKCPWQLYAAHVKGEDTFQVRTYKNEHNCGRVFRNKIIRAPWLAKKYLTEFRADPEWSIKSFTARLQTDYIVGCSRSQLYRARSMAISLVTGSEKEQYSKVYDYCEELRKSNPGTTAIVQTEASMIENGRPTFRRLYICLGACKKGFKAGCRKVIGVDGCHLKGSSTGQILAAVGIDANNQSFPLAYAVVEVENRETWEWFISLLKDDLDITRENEKDYTFINDKQKGLIHALEAEVGEAEHRHCAWHLYTNFKEHHKGKQLKEKMEQASRATTVPAFHKAMAELRALNEEAYKWLATKDEPRFWSRSHFRTLSKCDMLTNNPCESFNSFIKEARDKPILSLCETIRNLLMGRMSFRKQKMLKYGNKFCPNIVDKLEKLKVESCSWSPLWAGGLLYQVACSDYEQYSVDLEKKTCSCRKWDLSGIPCCHAISAIYHYNFVPEDFVDDCYLTETNLKIYNEPIYPMNGQSMWVETPFNRPLPPPYKKQPGRPKKLRRRGITEKPLPKTGKMPRGGMVMKCRTCGEEGHNTRSHKLQKTDSDVEPTETGNQSKGTARNTQRDPMQLSQSSISNSNTGHISTSNQKTASANANQRRGTTGEQTQQAPLQMSQASFCNSSSGQDRVQVSAPIQLRRSPRKRFLSSSQPPMQAQKLQPRKSAKASAVATGQASASATVSGCGTASANASSVSGKAKATASSSKLTSKQASRYQNLVKQGKFREM